MSENECNICYNIISDDEKLLIDDEVYPSCWFCVKYDLDNKVRNWIDSLREEDCEATIKRMLGNGIPIKYDEKVENFLKGREIISGYFFPQVLLTEITQLNKELKELIELVGILEYQSRLEEILGKIKY